MAKKVWVAVVAGGLLVGAGLISSVVSAPETALAQEDGDTEEKGLLPRAFGFLEEVLGGLVDDGTLTQDQADAVLEASEAKATELREQRQAERDQLESMLEDGVITEEEASQLPDDHPLFSDRYDEAWEDGELSADELRGFRRNGGRLDSFRHGMRFGALLDDGGIDQEEYDALPDDHPLKQADVTDYLEDGLITPDELHEIFHDLHNSDSGGDA